MISLLIEKSQQATPNWTQSETGQITQQLREQRNNFKKKREAKTHGRQSEKVHRCLKEIPEVNKKGWHIKIERDNAWNFLELKDMSSKLKGSHQPMNSLSKEQLVIVLDQG